MQRGAVHRQAGRQAPHQQVPEQATASRPQQQHWYKGMCNRQPTAAASTTTTARLSPDTLFLTPPHPPCFRSSYLSCLLPHSTRPMCWWCSASTATPWSVCPAAPGWGAHWCPGAATPTMAACSRAARPTPTWSWGSAASGWTSRRSSCRWAGGQGSGERRDTLTMTH